MDVSASLEVSVLLLPVPVEPPDGLMSGVFGVPVWLPSVVSGSEASVGAPVVLLTVPLSDPLISGAELSVAVVFPLVVSSVSELPVVSAWSFS